MTSSAVHEAARATGVTESRATVEEPPTPLAFSHSINYIPFLHSLLSLWISGISIV